MNKLARRLLVALAASAIGVLTIALIGVPLYVLPATDDVERADVVFVVGPINGPSLALAEDLMARQVSDTLVLSTPSDGVKDFCSADHDFELLCFEPSPSTTQGESQKLGELAEANHWDSAVVVASAPHVARVRLLMSRCFTGHLAVTTYWMDKPLSYWVHQYLYQTGAFVKAAVNQAC